MSFLHTIFADAPDVAKELAGDEERIQEELPALIANCTEKQRILDRMLEGESVYLHLHRLEALLARELELVEHEEHQEHEILDDLRFLSRESYVARLDALHARLGNALSKDAFLTSVFSDLHDVLRAQARKVARLAHVDGDFATAQGLTDLLLIERDIVERLAQVDDLRKLYHDLAIGVGREGAVSRAKRRVSETLAKQLRAVEIGGDGVARSTSGSYLSELAARVFNHLETGIAEAIETGTITGHDKADVEFIQSDWFDRFVREQVRTDAAQGKAVPSDRSIDGFITTFRSLYLAQAGASA